VDEDDDAQVLPKTFVLEQNYPNPFNPETRIVFYVPPGAEKQRVLIKIYDMLGRLVVVLFDREVAPGRHEVVWNGKDLNGTDLPSGTYLYRLEAGEVVIAKRMTLLR
jgi:flagellar hook assembly protein FlgD